MKPQLQVLGTDINLLKFKEEDYICITDMLKQKDSDGFYYISVYMKYRAKNSFGGYVIENYKAFFDIDGNPIKIDSWLSF